MDGVGNREAIGRRPSAAPGRTELPVAVIGAGPVGLAAAAHLLQRGLEPLVLEAGDTAGAALREWAHVPMFSPWRYNIDAAACALLERGGWTRPDEQHYPTGRELADRYVQPLARAIGNRLRLGLRVTAIARTRTGKVKTEGRAEHPFELRTIDREGRPGRLFARAVIDASGTWFTPNRAGSSGLAAMGEDDPQVAQRISYGMPDVLGAARRRYAGRHVAVLGSGHSATGTLIDLAKLAREVPETRITWISRSPIADKVFGGGADDQLVARGALGARLRELVEAGALAVVAPCAVDELAFDRGRLRIHGEGLDGEAVAVTVDELVVAAGFKPDLSLFAELRTDLDPALDCPRALGPLIDPNLHSCGTVRPHGAAELAQPEPDLFIIGMKAYGRAPTFLLATGYEQARSVAAHLAGDREAAARVELCLPETGVCSGPAVRIGVPAAGPTAAGCCAPAARGVKEPAAAGCCG